METLTQSKGERVLHPQKLLFSNILKLNTELPQAHLFTEDLKGCEPTSNMVAKSFFDVLKFNPYHDRRGRFTTAGGAASMTFRPGASVAHDNAIAREKERHERIMPTAAQAKTLKGIESRTRNLKKEQLRVVDREGNVVMQKQGDKHSVGFSRGEARDTMYGNITIHNHPDGGTFSTPDLSCIGYGATEIRAASPEGTYVLRNLRHKEKWISGQKSWVDMQEDLEAASLDFKSHFSLKKEVRSTFTEDQAKIDGITQKWKKAKDSGASQEELDKYYKEYDSAAAILRTKVEAATRTAYTNQYHEWYRKHSAEYGLEYEFIPVSTRARKSFYDDAMVNDISIVKSDSIVLDEKMNKDIEELTDAIMVELIGENPIKKRDIAKSFADIVKFNPYHDSRGRFTTAGAASSFTYRPGASVAHDRAIEREKERVKNAEKVITRTDRMASLVIDSQFISTDKKECVKDLQNCYQNITLRNGIRWDEEMHKIVVKRSAMEEIQGTAKKIMEKQEFEDNTTAQDYYDLHRTIKRTPVKISDYDKQNIADWNDYRKRAFGNLTISNSGISVDSFYQELSGKFPHLFDSRRETSPSDQLEKINDVLNSLRPKTYRLSGNDLEVATKELSMQIINGFMSVVNPNAA